jgi:hypothetical protein
MDATMAKQKRDEEKYLPICAKSIKSQIQFASIFAAEKQFLK